MSENKNIPSNENEVTYLRGSRTALNGLIVHLLITGLSLGVALWLGQRQLLVEAEAFFTVFLIVLPGNLAWLILFLIYKQHRQARLESLSIEAEARSDAQLAAIFNEQGESFKAAQKLLNQLYKYGMPGVSILMGLHLTIAGLVRLFYNQIPPQSPIGPAQQASATILVLAISGCFTSFIYGRYVAGMTQRDSWRLLRGGGGLLLGAAFMLLLTAVCAICSQLEKPLVWPFLVLAMNWLLLLSGGEILFSMLLGLYRPRGDGELRRAAFESRLLAWLAAPQSIRRIISETINYQFGFEVSRSAFYRFLATATMPLFLAGISILLIFSSIVVVAPQEQAIITTFGKPAESPKGPGVHLKWPWPISNVNRFATGRLYTLVLGSHTELPNDDMPVLWTNNHMPTESLMVTAPTYTEDQNNESEDEKMALALSGGQVVVQFKIKDLMQFAKRVPEREHYARMSDLRKSYDTLQHDRFQYIARLRDIENQLQVFSVLIRSIAASEVSEYFATHTIEQLLNNMDGDQTAGQELQSRMQAAYDKKDIGIEVVHVSMSGIHPPQDGVATAFLNFIGKQQEKETALEDARRDAIEILAQVAGSEAAAKDIFEKISKINAKSPAGDKVEIEDMIAASRGEAARLILAARANKTMMALGEKAQARKFASEYKAYKNAPRFFLTQKYLEAREKALNKSRFLIIDRDEGDAEPIIRMEMTKESRLDEILSPTIK